MCPVVVPNVIIPPTHPPTHPRPPPYHTLHAYVRERMMKCVTMNAWWNGDDHQKSANCSPPLMRTWASTTSSKFDKNPTSWDLMRLWFWLFDWRILCKPTFNRQTLRWTVSKLVLRTVDIEYLLPRLGWCGKSTMFPWDSWQDFRRMIWFWCFFALLLEVMGPVAVIICTYLKFQSY